MSLPPEVLAVLRLYCDERRSGQITLEFREGRIVAYSDHQKVRLSGGPPVSDAMEIKANGSR